MSKVRTLIEVFHKLTGSTTGSFTYASTASVTVTDGIVFDTDKSITASTDSFSFRVNNCKKGGNGVYTHQEDIKVDDRVIVYITSYEDITTANKSSYRRYDGVVTEINYTMDNKGGMLLVKGESRLNRLLNFTFPAQYKPATDFTSTADVIIRNLLQTVNEENINYQIGGATDAEWTALGNDEITADATNRIEFYRNYRPVIELITELSKQATNLEFNAYFYLDVDNNFIWKQKSKDSDGLALREGYEFTKIKIIEKVWDVVNAIIIDAGKDPSGNSIHAMYYDEGSAAEYGLKWMNTIETEEEIASNLISRCKNDAVTWINNSDVNKQNFPDNAAYTMTLPITTRDGNGVASTTAVTVANDAAWIAAIRKEAKWQAINYVKDIIDMTGHVKPRVDITMPGSVWELGYGHTKTSAELCLDSSGNPIQQGDFVKVESNSYGGRWSSRWDETATSPIKLRVTTVSHDVSTKGWEVTIRLEMDVDDAKTYVPYGH